MKVRENRLRRAAGRQGLRLVKSRRRDPRAYDYGRYWLQGENRALLTSEYGVTLDEVEKFLSGEECRVGVDHVLVAYNLMTPDERGALFSGNVTAHREE